jgi:hypothetical protein
MALDPIKVFDEYARAHCSVQLWQPGAPSVPFRSLRSAVQYAKDNGGRWNEVEITVHLQREDIVYASSKVHRLIDALGPSTSEKN